MVTYQFFFNEAPWESFVFILSNGRSKPRLTKQEPCESRKQEEGTIFSHLLEGLGSKPLATWSPRNPCISHRLPYFFFHFLSVEDQTQDHTPQNTYSTAERNSPLSLTFPTPESFALILSPNLK